MAGLTAKGYVEAAADPACLLEATFTAREKLVAGAGPTVGFGGGGGSGGSYGGVGITLPVGKRKDLTGSFRLRVIAAAGLDEIWSGSIDGSYAADVITKAEARAAVSQVMAQFPARAGP